MLRKLILKEWFRFFLSSCFVLLLLLTVANLISGLLRSNVSPRDVLFNYFIELPANIGRIIPISCLIASLFSINKLKNRNELVAIFASGLSRISFVNTIVFAALIAASVQFFVSSFVKPWVKSKRNILIENSEEKFRNLKSKGLWASTVGSSLLWYKSDQYYLSFAHYNGSLKKITKANIYYFDQSYQIKKVVSAAELDFSSSKNVWIGRDVQEIKMLNTPAFPIKNSYQVKEVVILEHPSDFKKLEADITTLSVIKLYYYISGLKTSGINVSEYQVLFLSNFSGFIICIIFSLISSISLFTPNRRNSSIGKNIATVFVFTILYWLINSYFFELGQNSKIDPYLACFAVPVVFSLYLLIFFFKNRRLS